MNIDSDVMAGDDPVDLAPGAIIRQGAFEAGVDIVKYSILGVAMVLLFPRWRKILLGGKK